MPIGLIRQNSSKLTSPSVTNGPTTVEGNGEDNPLCQSIATTSKAICHEEADQTSISSFPLHFPRVSDGGSFCDCCRTSWGTISQLCGDDTCSVEVPSNRTSVGGSSMSGMGCSFGGSSVQGLSSSNGGTYSSSNGGSCYNSDMRSNGGTSSGGGLPPRLRPLPHVAAGLKYAGLPWQSSLGAVAEQIDINESPPLLAADPTTPCAHSASLSIYPSGGGSEHGAIADAPSLSGQVASLREGWGVSEVVAGRTQEASPSPTPSIIGLREVDVSPFNEGARAQQEKDHLGRVDAMVALFGGAMTRSSTVGVSLRTSTSGGVTGLAPSGYSPVLPGFSSKPKGATSLHSRLNGSSGGANIRTRMMTSFTRMTTAADNALANASTGASGSGGVSTTNKVTQRPVPTASPPSQCVHNPAGATVTAANATSHAPIPVITAARPNTRSAGIYNNSSQSAKRSSASTSTLSQTAVRPPFNPYAKPSTTLTTAASMPVSAQPLSAHVSRSSVGTTGGNTSSTGRNQGTRPPRVVGQQVVTVMAGGSSQAGQRATILPMNTVSRATTSISTTAPADPQRPGRRSNSISRNNRFLRSGSSVSNTLSPNRKKNASTAVPDVARATATTSTLPSNTRGLLRPAVCRYSVDSFCSDSMPNICQASISPPLREDHDGSSPHRRSVQRLPAKQPPRTPRTLPAMNSLADTLHSPYLDSSDGLFNASQSLAPPQPLFGIEDVMPMASPIPAAIDGVGSSQGSADPRSVVLGVRERRRRLDTGWPWAMDESTQLPSAEEHFVDEVSAAKRRARLAARLRRGSGGSDASGNSDSNSDGDFGLPAWAWRSVAVLLSQSIEPSSHRERQSQTLDAERQTPPPQLLNYAQDDPSLVPLRRLSGTPHRRRGPSATAALVAQRHLPSATAMRLHSVASAPDELPSRPRHLHQPTSSSGEVYEDRTPVLLSRQAACGRYGPESPTLARRSVAADGSFVATASSGHSSDSEEPSEPLPVHDGAGGWEADTGAALSPGARLLPFSGSQIDALVFASLQLSNAGTMRNSVQPEDEPSAMMPDAAEESAGVRCVDLLNPGVAVCFTHYGLDHDRRVSEDAVHWTLQPCPASPSEQSSEDSDRSDENAMEVLDQNAVKVVEGDITEAASLLGASLLAPVHRTKKACPNRFELSAVIAMLVAGNTLLSNSSTSRAQEEPVASAADSTASWSTTWAAALCTTGTMAAVATEMNSGSMSIFAAAGMATAILLAAIFRHSSSSTRQTLATTRLSVNGLGKGGLSAESSSLRASLQLRKSINAAAGWHSLVSELVPDTVQDKERPCFLRKSSTSIEHSGPCWQNAVARDENDTLGAGGALSQVEDMVVMTEPLRNTNCNSATSCPWSGNAREGLIGIAVEAVDTCSEALSAMRAAGSDRAALRRLARACGVYAGMQMAASANGRRHVLNPTSKEWTTVQSLVRQHLGQPSRALVPWPPVASEAGFTPVESAVESGVVVPHTEAYIEVPHMCPGTRDDDREGCRAASRAESNYPAEAVQLATVTPEPALSLSSFPHQGSNGIPPLDVVLEGAACARVATADVITALSAQKDLLTLVPLATPNAGLRSASSAPSATQHRDAVLAAAAAEAAAVAFVAVLKSVTEENKLAKAAGPHCLLGGGVLLPEATPPPATDHTIADITCMFPAESTSALEKLAQHCRTRHAAYARAASTCSSISYLAGVAEAATLDALAFCRAEALAAHAESVAENAKVSMWATSAEDAAHQRLWEEGRAVLGKNFALEGGNSKVAICTTIAGESAVQALAARREQRLRDASQVIAGDAAVATLGGGACMVAVVALWSQRQQLLGCVAREAAASGAIAVRAAKGEDAAVNAYAAEKREILRLKSLEAGRNAAEALRSSMASMAAVKELIRRRSLQLQAVSETVAVDCAIGVAVVDLEEEACKACSERHRSYILTAVSVVAARESRTAWHSMSAEETALARLSRARSVLMGVCLTVEAMNAAIEQRGCLAAGAAMKALTRRRLRYKGAYACTLAAASETAIRAAAAEDYAMEKLLVRRQQELAEYAASIAENAEVCARVGEIEEAAQEQFNREHRTLLAGQLGTEAAGRYNVRTCGVDAAVGTTDLLDMSAAGQLLQMFALGFLELQKERLSLYAAVVGTSLAAMLATMLAGPWGVRVQGCPSNDVEGLQIGPQDGPVSGALTVRCFPLSSFASDDLDESAFVDTAAASCEPVVVTSFPVKLSEAGCNDGEQQSDGDDGNYDGGAHFTDQTEC